MDDNFFFRRGVNLDSTHRCPLMCPNCARQFHYNDNGLRVPGHDLKPDNYQKILDFFKKGINFEGQYSDPAHHPRFIEYLRRAYENKNHVQVQHAANKKKKEWYIEAWEAHPYAHWRYSIDGLPASSHQYRINQDGEFLFEMMVLSKQYLKHKPSWQYIVFKYNEHEIDDAIALAKEVDVNLYFLYSGRWRSANDPFMPSEQYRMRAGK